MTTVHALKLVCESKIRDLMPHDQSTDRLEASGVLVKDGYFHVAFDNRTEIARLSDDLRPNDTNRLVGVAREDHGYEGIAFNSAERRFYLLVESRKQKGGGYQGEIHEYDDQFRHVEDQPLDFSFKSSNKGFEAVAHVRYEGGDYVLALCEGNKCKGGDAGRKPGGGRVQLFEKKKKRWKHCDTIKLPATLPFVDYSAMSIDNCRVAIVSQENAMLWVGRFHEADWSWRDEGKLYDFPRTDDGNIQYGNVEGVGWISETRVVTVSDKRKKKHPDTTLAEKDQSIQLFDLPE